MMNGATMVWTDYSEVLDVLRSTGKLIVTTGRGVYTLDLEKLSASPPDHCQCPACIDGVIHSSDCAVHNMPAEPNGLCSCGAVDVRGIMDDAMRYRKLRGAWWGLDIVWDEAYLGITHARGDDLDRAVDALPPPSQEPSRER